MALAEEPVLGQWFGFFAELRDGTPTWKSRGACFGLDPDMFHPGRGQSTEPAKRICMQCPVQAECLEYALSHFLKCGIWGGASERERRQIRRERYAAKTLGVPLDQAVDIVNEQRAIHKLMKRFGYSEAQAQVVLERSRARAVA